MSDMEYHIGKLVHIYEGLNFKQGIDKIKDTIDSVELDYDLDDELLWDDRYFYINNKWYKNKNHEQFDPDNMMDYKVNKDGSVDYRVSFYNGGGSFNDVIKDIIDKLDPKED